MKDEILRQAESAVRALDRWFDRMRVDWPVPGYGGPVVHWWNHSLVYQGAGLDWRYEGIITGYLTLWRRTGEIEWLEKARRAGDDLVAGQLPDEHFMNSGFERNPSTGGTPHEAAADTGLLRLAGALRDSDPDADGTYLRTARRNLERFWLGQLWHEPTSTLWDRPGVPSFVPNKAATFLEAVLLLARLSDDASLVEHYAIPTGERILAMQVRQAGSVLDGAIAQNRFGDRVVWSFFPLYIARCVEPLLQLSAVTGDTRFRDAALRAVRFLGRVQERDGGFPQVLYPRGRCNRHPRWVAGAGDIVRALHAGIDHGLEIEVDRSVAWVLRGLREDGRVVTASGFGKVVPLVIRAGDKLDETGVVGWCDKAFRALATIADVRDKTMLERSELAGRLA